MAIPGIQEIQALATKYSKPQLQKMAQMGLIDPTKAVMAGMMIDRIQQQNMQPPQQTVAEEVMGAAPPPAPPPPGGAPSAPPPGGVAGLPSNLPPQMAGGGIVAFAEGGDTEDYASGGAVGYADRGLVDVRNDPMMKVDPRVQAQRDVTRYQILAEELRLAQARLNAGDPRAKADVEALQREMRSVKPRANVDISLPGISEARAAEPNALPPISSPSAKSPRAKSSTERLMEEQVREDIGYTDKPVSPEVKKASEESAAKALERQQAQKRLRELEGGFFEQKPMTDEQAAEAARLRQTIEGSTKPVPVAPAEPAKKFDVVPVEPKPVAKAEEKETEIDRPQLPPVRQMDVPAEAKFTDQYDQVRQAYTQAGIDVDLYKKLSDEIKEKKAGGASKRDVALGHAMMAFGFELFGARKGEFASKLSGAGQKSLYQYMSNMDKITENEEKLDALDRQVRLAEQQFKLTGADTALRRTENLNDKRTAIINKNVELAQNSDQLRANLAASLYNVDKTFQARMEANAARIINAMGNNRGGFTDKQLVDLRAQMEIQHGPALREQYKNRGSKEQIEKIVADEINQKVLDEVNRVRGIRQSGGIPVPSNAQNWQVTGGMD